MLPDNRTKTLKILIVTHAPIAPEFGVSQAALTFSRALEQMGHTVNVWCPPSATGTRKLLGNIIAMRGETMAFAAANGPFDIIDTTASLSLPALRKHARLLVVRDVGPDIQYLWSDVVQHSRNGVWGAVKSPLLFALFLCRLFLALKGWASAHHIFCLGTIEYEWMRNRFPRWHHKLHLYYDALSGEDQAALKLIRERRHHSSFDNIRFLWIGRWARHKGTELLISFVEEWSAEHPRDTFTIAGCGPAAEKRCPAELIRDGRLKIIPYFERNKIFRLLSEHNAGLFTSYVEGWGLSLQEMLESGMTVFATPAGAVTDLKHYFANTLRPFPPPKNLRPDVLKIPSVSEEYYKTFNWSNLADQYNKLLSKEA